MSRLLFTESSGNIGGQELQILRQMSALRSAGREVLLACAGDSAIAREADALGLPWHAVGFRNSIHPPSIVALRALMRGAAAVLCHSGHDADNVALAARLVRRRPVLVRVRTYQPGRPKSLSYNTLVDRTVVPSEHLRRQILRNRAIRAERIAVLRPILPLAEIRAQAAGSIPESLERVLGGCGPIVVHAAMLRAEKGHLVAIDAVAALARAYPSLLYVIAGSGPQERALRRRVAELGLRAHVHFAGFVAPVYPLLARADLVIMPSLDEPLGLSQLEALALGVPVAVSDAGGLPETVSHGETGWVLKAGDTAAWRDGLAQALAAPARGRAMAAKGRAFVEAVFSPQAHLASLEAELRLATTMRG